MDLAVERAVPALGWLRSYQRDWLRPDVLAGVAAGLVVVPQAMAYASIADLPVQIGLYTCMVPMAVYALVGGSRIMSVSTTSTIATLTASTLVAAGAASGDDALADLATLVLLAGLALLVARLFHLGPLVDNISDAIVTGLKVGVGLTVAAGQLPKVLGIPASADGDSFFAEASSVLHHLGDAHGLTVALSAVTIAVLLGLRKVLPQVPAPLVAVVGGIVLVAVFNLDDHGVALISKVPRGLPTPRMPAFDHVDTLLPGAIAIALMAYLESVSVARTVRRPSEPSIDNDQELTANGVAAVAGAFFGSLPPAGGFSQTAVNQEAGAKTQVSGLVTVGLAVAAALFLGPILDNLPEATLGAMVIVAVLGLIKPSEIAFLARFDRLELFIALLTAGIGLTFGLLVAVAVGVIANLLIVLRELNHAGVQELHPAGDPTPDVLVLRIEAPVYTGNARGIQAKILDRVVAAEPQPRMVVVDATVVGRLSATGISAFRDLQIELDAQGVELWFAGLPPRALAQAHLLPGWEQLNTDGRLHPTAEAAVSAWRARHVR